jgi:two-component system, response regulator PdtaR
MMSSIIVKTDVTIASGTTLAALTRNSADPSILIVEDNPFVARQCESALIAAGYEVVDIVTTANDAVKVALERLPLLVLMDIYLPGERDGVDAAIEIVERCGIRSIFASAPVDSAGKVRAEGAQPLAWLPKPFSDKKLITTVASAIVAVAANLQPAIHESLTPKPGTRDAEAGPRAPNGSAPKFHDIPARIAASKGAGDADIPVSRDAADALIDIQETAIEREHNGRFNELLVKSIAHHAVAADGRVVPALSGARARNAPALH